MASGDGKAAPRVGIVMGSASDLQVMSEAAQALESLGVACEVTVASAHRTPDRAIAYARAAAGRGLRVIIAGAGGAAHLPGVLAALTPLPVIGVPLRAAISLDGWDSLLSIAQMPPGVPVAAVGVDAARNAGILAAQIIALGDPAVAAAIDRQREATRSKIEQAAADLEARGYRAVLAGPA